MSAITETFATALKDSGSRQDFTSGAVRDNPTGKGRMDLLPAEAIIEVAKHFEKGASKYAARNWEKGIPYSRYIDSALRHTFQFLAGRTDEPHLISAAWNLLCLIQTIQWVEQGVLSSDLNDLPKRTQTSLSRHNAANQDNRDAEPSDVPSHNCGCGACAIDPADDLNGPPLVPEVNDHDLLTDLLDILTPLTPTGGNVVNTLRQLVEDPAAAVVQNDEAALTAYTIIARRIFGPYLTTAYADEDFPEDIQVSHTAFAWDNDTPQYYWDGVGSVTWNDGGTYGPTCHTPVTPAQAAAYFASGEWTPIEFHGRIITRRYRPVKNSNPGLKRIEFGVEDNKFYGVFVYNNGREQKNRWSLAAYENDPGYAEVV